MTKVVAHEAYAGAAALVLLLGVIHEIFRLLVVPWSNIPFGHSAFISILLIAIWTTAVATLIVQRRANEMSAFALVISIVATFAMLAHGVMTRVVANDFLGLAYLAGAAILGYCLIHTWRGRAVRYPRP
jgi:uncharacterized membrane protein